MSTPRKWHCERRRQAFAGFSLTLMPGMPLDYAGQIPGENDLRKWRMGFDHAKAAHAWLIFDNVVRFRVDRLNRR